ncbi:MAG: hypothetical protein M3076_10210 [Actinomycetota bacterium]|nr:hypothetical protein [Actinomycetota bacterium]
MARVVAYVPDLLFGSNVLAQLSAAGHAAVLVADLKTLRDSLPGAEAIVLDLTSDASERIQHVRESRPPGVRVLAFYSHVETDVRQLANRAGLDLVVPRSRMAREGGRLLDGLLTAQR